MGSGQQIPILRPPGDFNHTYPSVCAAFSWVDWQAELSSQAQQRAAGCVEQVRRDACGRQSHAEEGSPFQGSTWTTAWALTS